MKNFRSTSERQGRNDPARFGTMIALALALFSAQWSPAALPQAFPSKPVRLIVGGPPGGAPDIVARMLARELSQSLDQQVVVENRPGAGGTLAAAAVGKSPNDGYTLLLGTASNLACAPSLYPTIAYDPIRSFAPISRLTRSTYVIVAGSAVPASSLQELISLAKSKPGELRFGSNGNGGALHIAGEMFKSAAGVDLLHVPYKGGSFAMVDLLASRIEIIFEQPAAYLPHIRAGKLKALAVAGPTRLAQLPDVPTATEAGLPGYEVISQFSLLAPQGTLDQVVRRLNAEVLKALTTKEIHDALSTRSIEAVGSSPEELASLITSELARCSRVIKSAGIRLD